MPIGPARMSLMEHLGELRMRLVRIVVAVSYTHLDVYKRQRCASRTQERIVSMKSWA